MTASAIPENYVPFWDTRDFQNLKAMYCDPDQKLFNPYTKVAPPTGPNIKITGFDWTLNVWTYLEVATPEDLAQQDGQLTDTMLAIVELYQQGSAFEDRLSALEKPKEE